MTDYMNTKNAALTLRWALDLIGQGDTPELVSARGQVGRVVEWLERPAPPSDGPSLMSRFFESLVSGGYSLLTDRYLTTPAPSPVVPTVPELLHERLKAADRELREARHAATDRYAWHAFDNQLEGVMLALRLLDELGGASNAAEVPDAH